MAPADKPLPNNVTDSDAESLCAGHPAEVQSNTPTLLVRRGVLALISAYQLARLGRVSPCRFTPTCSQYAMEAIERHGAAHGLSLTVRRLARCRPGGPSGYDPIPE